MRKKIWRTGNRMQIDTGCTTFNRQCDGVSTGNVCGGVQYSNYIRPRTETECNGKEDYAPGHLRDFDLQHFKMPSHIRGFVETETENKTAILYEIRHWTTKDGEHRKNLHGWILTRGHDDDHRLIWICPANTREKSRRVLETVAEYISNPKDNSSPVQAGEVEQAAGTPAAQEDPVT